ncbi:DUF1801 domain-containing protein [Niabella beijingensis]|uniref:DUF1801 domain-containing protein n=1 Tax=Niabella beijingensis TaxID=2872700 RepID=UPI001CC0162C|nr:DUF1801 domain-containing protein [Niabella beijingensis]MBZ4187279.1 DUF1801 domain-containing protein [Niabella beijingensis]
MHATAVETFLAQYAEQVQGNALLLRQVLLQQLPQITEQLDLPAKMIAYTYGQSYTDFICVIIPSQKGLKLGFNKGPELSDPGRLLQGTAKTTRYIPVSSAEQIQSEGIATLLREALKHYRQRKKALL